MKRLIAHNFTRFKYFAAVIYQANNRITIALYGKDASNHPDI